MSSPLHDRSPRRGRARTPLPWMFLLAVGIGGLGAAGVLRAADSRTDDVDRIEGLAAVLAEPPAGDVEYPAENYLLVGSDSREGIEGEYIGGELEVSGQRSDTIMILRQERNGGAALISIPRDLWLEIAGTGENGRVNSAYNEGPERLAATITQSLGIPIHHYVEVDFTGFKEIVDGIGGVDICVPNMARDHRTGLMLNPGCQHLDGEMGLAYARSRHYEEWKDDDWVTDPRADLGRIERQQHFLRAAVDGLMNQIASSPFTAGESMEAVIEAVRIDDRLDPIQAATALRSAAGLGLRTYRLPVYNDKVGDASVLRLDDGSDAVLAYFRGEGPAPAEFETGETAPVAPVASTPAP